MNQTFADGKSHGAIFGRFESQFIAAAPIIYSPPAFKPREGANGSTGHHARHGKAASHSFCPRRADLSQSRSLDIRLEPSHSSSYSSELIGWHPC